jgi:hypothetical protein
MLTFWPRINTLLLVLVLLTLLAILGLLAASARGGELDPSDPVGSTMRPLDDLMPSWGAILSSSGADPCDTPRFECVMGGAAVLDHETGLVWQRTPNPAPINGAQARADCWLTNTGDRYGWRLPSISELSSLLDDTVLSPAFSLPPSPFALSTQTGQFWSHTHVDAVDSYLVVYFRNPDPGEPGVIAAHTLATPGGHAWCVRSPVLGDF